MKKNELKEYVHLLTSVISDVLIYVLIQMIVQFFYAFVIYFRSINPEKSLLIAVQSSILEVSKSQLLLALISILLSFIIIIIKYSSKEKKNILVPKFKKMSLVMSFSGILSGIAFSFSVYIVLSLLSRHNISVSKHIDDISVVYYVVVCFMSPILEEFLFRHVITNKLLRKFPAIYAVILQAFLFAIIHSNVSQKIYTFLLGCLLGILVVGIQNFIIPVVIHIIFNIIGTGIIDISSLDLSWCYICLIISIILLIFSLMINRKLIKGGSVMFIKLNKNESSKTDNKTLKRSPDSLILRLKKRANSSDKKKKN